MKQLNSYKLRLKRRSNLPILHKQTSNGIYIALDFKTDRTYEVICNSNGSQKSGGGRWTDIAVNQRLSPLKGKGRDKYLNQRTFKNYNQALEELLALEKEVKNLKDIGR